jgi:hypothetical protein
MEATSEVFNLANNVEELGPINNGIIRPQYRQVSAQKAVEDGAFPSGQQVYRFNVSGTTWWCPSKTYFSFRCAYSEPNPNDLANFGYNMGMISNLYQSCELRMGDKVIQRVSQNMPQIDALIQRSSKSIAWLNNLGDDINAWDADFTVRQTNLAQAAEKEFVYKPPLMLFHSYDGCLPAGDYSIVLTPQPATQYKNQVLESSTVLAQSGVNFDFAVKRIHLNVATVEGPRVDSKQYALSLDHIECQTSKLLGGTSMSQLQFNVSPATTALAVAYQDTRLVNGEMSASKYQITGLGNPQAEDANSHQGSLALQRLYVQYDGLQRPSPDADPEFTDPGKNYFTERYYETVAETGMLYDEAGPENQTEWKIRGPYYYFNWNRDSRSGATRVTVNQQFGDADVVNNGNCLLFAMSKTSAIVTVRNGEITNVEQIER